MTRAGLLLAPLALVVAGCLGLGGDAEPVLRETAAKLPEIRSGTLDMALLVEPREGEPFGFELSGPFELAEGGGLPKLRVDYTQIASGQRATVTIVSDGEQAWAEANGERVELTAAQVEDLRGASATLGGDGLSLPVDDWIESADVSDGGEVGGATTDKVEGELDIVATVNGLVGLMRGLGRDVGTLEGAQAERLREATESATFLLHTGKEDRLLRLLELRATFGLDTPEDLRRALGDAVGADVLFRLGVTNPNEPVSIEGP